MGELRVELSGIALSNIQEALNLIPSTTKTKLKSLKQ
jgi:hypothetical protein